MTPERPLTGRNRQHQQEVEDFIVLTIGNDEVLPTMPTDGAHGGHKTDIEGLDSFITSFYSRVDIHKVNNLGGRKRKLEAMIVDSDEEDDRTSKDTQGKDERGALVKKKPKILEAVPDEHHSRMPQNKTEPLKGFSEGEKSVPQKQEKRRGRPPGALNKSKIETQGSNLRKDINSTFAEAPEAPNASKGRDSNRRDFNESAVIEAVLDLQNKLKEIEKKQKETDAKIEATREEIMKNLQRMAEGFSAHEQAISGLTQWCEDQC